MTSTPLTIRPPTTPDAPDADWATVIDRVMQTLAQSAATWSDHNLPDPGVTLAEVAAYGVADLHYRTAERDFAAWPLEVRDYEPDSERHWYAVLPPAAFAGIAGPLANPTTSAVLLEPLVRGCRDLSEAMDLLTTPPWDGVWSAAEKPVVIALMRGRLVRQTAHENADLVAAALDAADAAAPTKPVADRDARAALRLGDLLPLWPTELAALVRRERRRRAQESMVALLGRVQAVATSADDLSCRQDLHQAGLDDSGSLSEVDVAMAAARMPVGVLPEDLEDGDGRTRVWPAHPVQALTCEPVVAEDYARRAREHPDVGRAWAVTGRLRGVAWNGLPVSASQADPEAPAITLVVERVRHTSAPIEAFLRQVLRVAVGGECGDPFPTWRDSYDANDARRVICDEVGASLLRQAPVVVTAVVVTPVGVDPEQVLQGVRDRISAFFAAGRGPAVAPPEPQVHGPWPLHPQPSGGWVPGDPVRFTEVIQAMVADPAVLGVEGLQMQVTGDPHIATMAEGMLAIPPDAVPVRADQDCLSIRFATTGACSDA